MLHAINFALLLGGYRAQLTALADALADHPGPIIYAGDLNTWTQARNDVMRDVADKLHLTEITFKDASKFWGLPENAQGEEVDQHLKKVPDALNQVEQLLIGETVELSDGQSVSQQQLRTLESVHRFLKDQFTRHLSQMRERTRRF